MIEIGKDETSCCLTLEDAQRRSIHYAQLLPRKDTNLSLEQISGEAD